MIAAERDLRKEVTFFVLSAMLFELCVSASGPVTFRIQQYRIRSCRRTYVLRH